MDTHKEAGVTGGDSIKVVRPLFQEGGDGSIPISPLHFQIGQREAVDELCITYHYKHNIPSVNLLYGSFHVGGGLFGDMGECVAGCIIGLPPSTWAEPVLELSRLVRKPECDAPLTRLIALTIRAAIRRKLGDLIVSYADITQGHHGGIYQAASWNYHGERRPTVQDLIINGKKVSAKACSDRYGAWSSISLLKRGIIAEEIRDKGKHLYWKALTNSGARKAERLKLYVQAYPKPRVYSRKDDHGK